MEPEKSFVDRDAVLRLHSVVREAPSVPE
jgi:hypothetical protein